MTNIPNSFFIITLSLFLIFSGCTSTNQSMINHQEVEIIESSKENWHGGAKPGYQGTDYFITVVVKTDQLISFDSIWSENKSAKIKTIKNDIRINNNEAEINKGDTLKLRATFIQKSSDTLKISPPININSNQAVISTIINGSVKYLKTDEFELIKGPPRP